jgi:hypothetical protein
MTHGTKASRYGTVQYLQIKNNEIPKGNKS